MSEFLNTTHRTISWLKQVHDANALEMKPPFQRNPVWTDAQKAYLIDSILQGYPIPELYMQMEVDEEGSEKHIVVDGQQRVRACLEFVEGKYAMTPEDSPQWPDMKFDDLSTQDKKKLFGYQFIVRNLPLVPDETLRQIFKRLNRNVVALNAQELRHAAYWGPFIKLMEELSNYEYWEGSRIYSANDIRRMLDVEFISELAIAVLHGLQNKKANLEKMYQTYESIFEEAPKVKDTFQKTLAELSQILPNLKETRWRKRSDFYTLFLVFATHVSSLPLSREARTSARRLLEKFAQGVDTCVAVEAKNRKNMKSTIIRYSAAVERSASDLGARKARAEALEKELKSIWKA